MRQRLTSWSVALLLVVAAACGGNITGNNDGGSDGSVATDGRVPADAQVLDDGAVVLDGRVISDGSVTFDGSVDGSVSLDGSVLPDGSVSPDGSVLPDGSVQPDASTPDGSVIPDAGEPDAGPLCEGVDCSGLDDICALGVCNPGTGICESMPKAPGASCNDGLYCTTNDECDGNGACEGTARSCDDSLTCTADSCDENNNVCTHALANNKCLVNNKCYNANGANPSNQCQSCQPGVTTTAFSNKNAGVSCNDKLYCTTDDVCDGNGACAGVARNCDDARTCTTDSCNEATDSCAYVAVPNNCLINSMCVAGGTTNPLNPCQECNANVSLTAWSPKAGGTSCDDNQFCTVNDQCNLFGVCEGGDRDCGDGLGCTADICNEGSDTCSHEQNANTCLVNGTCFAEGNTNPVNDCEQCSSEANPADWSPRDLGASCGGVAPAAADNVCDGGGMCIVGCNEGFDDCDNDLASGNSNGCETTLGTTANCLSCGNACGMGNECTASGCKSKLRIFVTAAAYDGDFDGVSKADLTCQSLADSRNLGGVWQAWLSASNNSAASRFLTQGTVPYVLVDGTTQVADNWADLTDGTLDHVINKSETGGAITNKTVWTGTKKSGAAGATNCTGFTSLASNVTAVTGSTGSATATWTEGAAAGCNLSYRIYCVEQ